MNIQNLRLKFRLFRIRAHRKFMNACEKVLLILGFFMVMNITAYIVEPKWIMPVYKTINSVIHDERITNKSDVKKIFNDLKRFIPRESTTSLRLTISDSMMVNAWVNHRGDVTMTLGMLKALKYDKGAIAAVLGHEIAHYVLAHHETREQGSGLTKTAYQETIADRFGILLSKSAGYNGCNVEKYWSSVNDLYGSRMSASTHPTSLYRADSVKKLCGMLL